MNTAHNEQAQPAEGPVRGRVQSCVAKLREAQALVVERRAREADDATAYYQARLLLEQRKAGPDYVARKLAILAQTRAYREEAEATVMYYEGCLAGKW